MNNCEHMEDLFSDRFDGELSARDQESFDQHVANCGNCNGNWLEYQEALSILATSGGSDTSAELAAATIAAVDAATMPARQTSPTKPLVLAAILGAAAALLIAWFVTGMVSSDALNITVGADIVALHRGESRSHDGVTLSRSRSGELMVHSEDVEPETVEVRVEVPVDRIVEVPVEVEVKVPVEVPVEVVVKVPVAVPRGPWVTIDTSPLALAVREAGRQIGSSMEALAASRRAVQQAPPKSTIRPIRSPLAKASRKGRDAHLAGSALRVRRIDDRIVLETSGTLDEVVTSLIAQLETPDAELCSMIQRRLATIHEEAALDPNIGSELADMPSGNAVPVYAPSLFGDPSQPTRAPAPAVAWTKWWNANSELLTQVASL